MVSQAHRRHVLLFLVAVLLPCSVLVALGVRIVAQEHELSEQRLEDERQRVVDGVHDDLLARLERIKLRETALLAGQEPRSETAVAERIKVVLVAHLRDGRLVPPWDGNDRSEIARRHLDEGDYAAAVREGERRELIVKDLGGAIGSYRQALRTAGHPVQRAYARLMLGRVLTKAGRLQDATTHYRAILSSPSDVTDDLGVPLWLYAAGRLVAADIDVAEVLERAQRDVTGNRWFSPPPTEVYMLRDLAVNLASAEADSAFHAGVAKLSDSVAERLVLVEQTLALQRDLAGLGLTPTATRPGSVEPRWVLYGSPEWLVSTALPLGDSPATVVAVQARDAFSSAEHASASLNAVGALRLKPGDSSGGRLLGPSFPGIKVEFAAGDDTGFLAAWDLQRSFYLLTLLLVLSVTLFGAYLLWRDVRRELRLAELRTQFVSGVSHELKTPLTAIRMFAETLRMRRSTDTRVQDEYLDTIVNESERLTRLLNNVLDFSKLEQGKKQYQREPCSLAEIVEATANAMRYPLQQQGFELHVETADDLPSVDVDRDAIEQALLNLLTNAMKYSGESRDIDLRLRQCNGDALIEVSDRGVGIEPEEQVRIFEKFYRAHTPENDHIPGTGIGLT
ncbi:MAG: HAMP domain-containing histidine kinase, partial [Gemmatimonadetes bacterium]|nr:HAMP domain-containing histidine kinase [Gemmatimonadota bacterium]